MFEEEGFLEELQVGFIQDARDLLDETEQAYLEMEKKSDKPSVMEKIFRCVHTIKGTAGTVDFKYLCDFTHIVENLLVKLKNGKIKNNPEITSLLLKCNDRIKKYIDLIEQDRKGVLDTNDLEMQIEKQIILADLNKTAEYVQVEKSESRLSTECQKELVELMEAKQSEFKDIGTILVEDQVINDQQLDYAVGMQNKKLGEILVDHGACDSFDIDKALHKQGLNKAKHPEEFVKLPLSKIDHLLDYLGEQVILQTSLDYGRKDLVKNGELVEKTIIQLNKITHDLQQIAISLRMFSLKTIFNQAQRIVRDTALKLGKEIELKKFGENTELDKSILDELTGPVTHLIRNSVDHGIEAPEERISCGKSRIGRVELHAYHKGGFFYLKIYDDGKGLDLKKIRQKAISKGLVSESKQLSDKEIGKFIFASGLSTKDEATDVSGRGVGMDVVNTAIEKMKGTIDVETQAGFGTTMMIKLPLSLAIFNGMVVSVSSETYVLPNSEVKEICHLDMINVRRLNDAESMIEIKNEVIPFIDLRKIFNSQKITRTQDKKCILLVVSQHEKNYALRIDDIIGQQKIVLKKLGAENENIPGVAGGTILGDGRVALILDINEIIGLYTKR
ncbi:MAG: hypothetical protein A2381_13125 [Bdellovibrionales bacterium RIFOXYB1_FULL_37_110]|nr:MAG: hypothetical protein A2181_02450 [Bdellovibrionales bacterium RIFOXYA1_FULL_38_20]OFZ51648.1 MAG: hypothetical protein A2417_12785 [Bdellovibrionales bacterium RIFOXYC1_FULL_37_79]OFZ60475.1 MAG: hypothetical protein A2381_13125 [Bdellovibrionales bacterium RIFOXYB1_FULL_37_110]OFZ65049.1 MAG: hypothetical protein A2577_09390 [Bdellovibrionales bacterium RIFOXYD1_FULL_36_51]